MQIKTTRFGEVEIDESRILNFIEPIIGYSNYTQYTIIEQEGNELFQWLQCVEDEALAFPISVPSYFNIEYSFEIDDNTAQRLGITKAEDVMILNLVTIPQNNPQGATINLLGPIIVNKTNNNGLQYILANSSFTTRYPLFK